MWICESSNGEYEWLLVFTCSSKVDCNFCFIRATIRRQNFCKYCTWLLTLNGCSLEPGNGACTISTSWFWINVEIASMQRRVGASLLCSPELSSDFTDCATFRQIIKLRCEDVKNDMRVYDMGFTRKVILAGKCLLKF
ncbi:hypothetical protein T11_4338 [Trichinella zimbabwensis]|uniref:Uncharacterized protein n=1 Tax=Trichinella zimbabwensis TaxID=268475 RepID=A0A0V1HG21_9BILA|nr:hypothetical protein T11_4338 [Trichinella zimbabwensis]